MWNRRLFSIIEYKKKLITDKLKTSTVTMKTTQECLRFAIVLGQCFAMFPVCCISGDYSLIKFTYKSKRTIYSLAFSFALAANALMYSYGMLRRTVKFLVLVGQLFFVTCFLTTILFIRLAKIWPGLMKQWYSVDKCLAEYGFPKKLNRKLKIVSLTVMLAASVEHTLFLVFIIKGIPKENSWLDVMDKYFQNAFEHVFYILPYHLVLGFLMQILNSFCTFTWNYMDLFIMLISICLSSRFGQIVEKIKLFQHYKVEEESRWAKIRKQYYELSEFVKVIDKAIGNIVVLSFANNIFVILVQLYSSIQPGRAKDLIEKVYFVYSFAFLIARTIGVALYASTIDFESRAPLKILVSLSEEQYNIEVERFILQVKYDYASLTGNRLFVVNRTLLLNIAGAIVTYELIVIQFNKLT